MSLPLDSVVDIDCPNQLLEVFPCKRASETSQTLFYDFVESSGRLSELTWCFLVRRVRWLWDQFAALGLTELTNLPSSYVLVQFLSLLFCSRATNRFRCSTQIVSLFYPLELQFDAEVWANAGAARQLIVRIWREVSLFRRPGLLMPDQLPSWGGWKH